MTRARAESEWPDEHPEYDIESEDFPTRVYGMAHPVYMWDGGGDLQELQSEAPHRAYVVHVYSRVARLVEVLRSLSVVEKLLSMNQFPVDTPDGGIHREAWLRVAIDTGLARITAVRDCLFLLTATVLEFDGPDRSVTLATLRRATSQPELVDVLTRIAEAARDTRDERDLKFHRGIEREFDDAGHYKHLSVIELWGEGKFDGKLRAHDTGEVTWDLRKVHEDAVDTVRTEMREAAHMLIDLCLDLFDLLQPEYDGRWAARRDRANDVRNWER